MHDMRGIGLGIVFSHRPKLRSFFEHSRSVWSVEYPNGWSRRSVMDYRGSVIYTRWIPPEM